MIDLHCHILPNVDDGPKNIEEAIELIVTAQKLGYKKLCCTSHYRAGKYENKNYNESLKRLKDRLELEKIDVELLCGNEFFLDFDGMTALKEKQVKTINNSNYLLVEGMQGMTLTVIEKALKKIINYGYRPILAHAERYSIINFKMLCELKKMGVIIQVNIGSLRHKKELYEWIGLNLVDILASDAHDKKYRNYDLEDILVEIDNKFGKEVRERLLVENPKKIINNEGIEVKIDGKKFSDDNDDDDNFIKSFFKRLKFRRST